MGDTGACCQHEGLSLSETMLGRVLGVKEHPMNARTQTFHWTIVLQAWLLSTSHLMLQLYKLASPNKATTYPQPQVTLPALVAQGSTVPLQSLSWLHWHSSLGEVGGEPGHLQPLSHLQNLPGRRRVLGESGIHSAQTLKHRGENKQVFFFLKSLSSCKQTNQQPARN